MRNQLFALGTVIATALILAGPAQAAYEPGDVSYLGSFQLESPIGSYSQTGLAYDDSGIEELLYYSNGSSVYASTIPALVTPNPAWDNLNVGTDNYSSTHNRAGGMAVREGTLYTTGATGHRPTFNVRVNQTSPNPESAAVNGEKLNRSKKS